MALLMAIWASCGAWRKKKRKREPNLHVTTRHNARVENLLASSHMHVCNVFCVSLSNQSRTMCICGGNSRSAIASNSPKAEKEKEEVNQNEENIPKNPIRHH